MQYDDNRLFDMIPLYINGSLSRDDRVAFEEALKHNEALLSEYRLFTSINSAFNQHDKLDKQSSEILFDNIEKKISSEVIQKNNSDQKTEKSLISVLADWLLLPQVAWGTTAIFLVTLIVYTGHESGHEYQTLSMSGGESVQPRDAIQVIFSQDASYEEVTQLLFDVNATIVRGPSRKGLLLIESSNSSETIIQLKKSPHVVFVERSKE